MPTEPLYFLKAPSALISDGEAIVLPPQSAEVHHEGEAALVLSAALKNASPEEGAAAIGGWTVLNDVTARDLQRADKGRFTRAKGFDTFCPLSSDRAPTLDWRQARIQCRVNGTMRQDGALADLVFTPGEILSHVSAVMTLMPGDIVTLGTPAGVGELHAGDEVEVRLLDGSGVVVASVTNPVRRPDSPS